MDFDINNNMPSENKMKGAKHVNSDYKSASYAVISDMQKRKEEAKRRQVKEMTGSGIYINDGVTDRLLGNKNESSKYSSLKDKKSYEYGYITIGNRKIRAIVDILNELIESIIESDFKKLDESQREKLAKVDPLILDDIRKKISILFKEDYEVILKEEQLLDISSFSSDILTTIFEEEIVDIVKKDIANGITLKDKMLSSSVVYDYYYTEQLMNSLEDVVSSKSKR